MWEIDSPLELAKLAATRGGIGRKLRGQSSSLAADQPALYPTVIASPTSLCYFLNEQTLTSQLAIRVSPCRRWSVLSRNPPVPSVSEPLSLEDFVYEDSVYCWRHQGMETKQERQRRLDSQPVTAHPLTPVQ